MSNNPSLHKRAIFSGKLQASILVTLETDPSAGRSESALARACGATRNAIRDALDHLELCQFVQRKTAKGLVAILPN
jgi:DNA-binding GntR family transcriptional regulator